MILRKEDNCKEKQKTVQRMQRREGRYKKILFFTALSVFLGGTVPFPSGAEAEIKKVKVRIELEELDENGEPVLTAEAVGSRYEVEYVMLKEGLEARGPAREKHRKEAEQSVKNQEQGAEKQGQGGEKQGQGGEKQGQGGEKQGQGGEKQGQGGENQEPGAKENEQDTKENGLDGMGKRKDKYICEIELSAEEGKRFSVLEKKDIQLSGLEADCTKAIRKNGGSVLVLTVCLRGQKEAAQKMGTVVFSKKGIAVWDAPAGAEAYAVQLYRSFGRMGATHRTGGTKFDFSPLMTETGDYYCKVTPIFAGGKKGKPAESARLYISEPAADANRQQDFGGAPRWERGDAGLRYWYADGLYPQNTCLEIDGLRYAFASDGYLLEAALDGAK